MAETVTFKGKKLHLRGELLQEGKKLPECLLMNANLEEIPLTSFKGKPLLVITVPSLDTDVCSREAGRFNQEIEKFKENLHVALVSMDLPFAQKRWCDAAKAKNLSFLSDYKQHDVGKNFGVYIEEIGLLARALFLFDHNSTLRYRYLVPEITEEPPYPKVLEQINALLSKK
jgi:thioredoxin-dependent peroxiredoxin